MRNFGTHSTVHVNTFRWLEDFKEFSYLFCDHPELLKVYHALHIAVIAKMDEGEILLDDWPEWNDGRLDILCIDQIPVSAHVPTGVHQLLHLIEQSHVLGGELLPSSLEPVDSAVTKAGDDGKHRVEVLSLFTLSGNLDELFDCPHPLV